MLVGNVNFGQALPSVRIAGFFCQRITLITLIFSFNNERHEHHEFLFCHQMNPMNQIIYCTIRLVHLVCLVIIISVISVICCSFITKDNLCNQRNLLTPPLKPCPHRLTPFAYICIIKHTKIYINTK